MAWMDYGPAFKMEKKYKDQPKAQWPPLVPLRQWSDVVFLQWKDLFKTSNAKDDITDLRYVFRITISNEDSTALILKAVKNKGAEFGYWPGTEFEPQSDEFKAILGSPNGAGVAWFLIDHKAQLGMKTVSKITVFRYVHQQMIASMPYRQLLTHPNFSILGMKEKLTKINRSCC